MDPGFLESIPYTSGPTYLFKGLLPHSIGEAEDRGVIRESTKNTK